MLRVHAKTTCKSIDYAKTGLTATNPIRLAKNFLCTSFLQYAQILPHAEAIPISHQLQTHNSIGTCARCTGNCIGGIQNLRQQVSPVCKKSIRPNAKSLPICNRNRTTEACLDQFLQSNGKNLEIWSKNWINDYHIIYQELTNKEAKPALVKIYQF